MIYDPPDDATILEMARRMSGFTPAGDTQGQQDVQITTDTATLDEDAELALAEANAVLAQP